MQVHVLASLAFAFLISCFALWFLAQYATHVVSPCMGLVNGIAESVSCFGSGSISTDLKRKSGFSSAVQSCHVKIKGELVEQNSSFLSFPLGSFDHNRQATTSNEWLAQRPIRKQAWT